ncbi:MAG: Flp pilus assembly protein CpaB [Pseudomonadota bacterium]
MKRPQIIGIVVAAGAGLMAMFGAHMLVDQPKQKEIVRETVDATKVLVARGDIGLGTMTESNSFEWKEWPRDAVSPNYITFDRDPNAMQELAGGVARMPMNRWEPITSAKLIQSGKGGVLAAILPAGKRAVATKITQQSAVAKMILPNDHVDVILTQRKRSRDGSEEFVADTLFRNIRVLAIGQNIETVGDKKGSEGEVATLELTPRQAEMLALANSMGEINLALRSIADIASTANTTGTALQQKEEASGAVNVTRYGATTRAYGVN